MLLLFIYFLTDRTLQKKKIEIQCSFNEKLQPKSDKINLLLNPSIFLF